MKDEFWSENGTIKIYTGTPLHGVPQLFFLDLILYGLERTEENLWNIFQGARGEASFDFLRVVENPAEADFFLLPYNYFSFRAQGGAVADDYISRLVSLSEKYKKKILVFALADSDEYVDIPRSYIFRYSQYGYKKKENEILMPPYLPHFRNPALADYRKNIWEHISLRKKGEKPIVSFCGWANFPSVYRRFTYGLRILIAYIQTYILGKKYAMLHLHGIYFRRKSINALKNSKLIDTKFLLRKSFSAQKGLDGKQRINSETAEREYVENILNSDFVLAPKGHANESVRFYEALSLGRFPVLIDTDKVLPLEGRIPYEKFMVRVNYADIKSTERKIIDFYSSLSDEELKKRQKMAREAFELLRPGSFLKIVLSELKQRK